MVLTLELPIRPAAIDLFASYERRFGALPLWLDEFLPATPATSCARPCAVVRR